MSALTPSAKYPSFSFEDEGLGAEFRGVITQEPLDSQASKYNPDPKAKRELDFWPDGNPIMQTRIVARMADGIERAIYAKGRMAKAITAALIEAGASDIEVGSEISVKWTEGKGKAGSPRLYAASYTAPVPGSFRDDDEPPF
jgi:hypothetical protein